MAGLDTRGFVSGAAQGFGLAQNHIDTERRRDREDELMEWEKADRQTRAQDRRRTIGIQDEQLEWQRENQEFQSRQNNWAEFQQDFTPVMADYAQGAELTDDQWKVVGVGVRNHPGRMQSDLAGAYRARQAQWVIPTIQNLMTNGDSVSDEDLDAAEEGPVPLSHAISDEQGAALAVADDLMNPETETNMRSPQVIDAINTIWSPRLGEGKRITAIIPGRQPGTLAFEIEVTEQDGSKRNAPMTRGRATAEDGDNEILQVPVEDIMNELQDAKALFQAFQQNPEARARVLNHAISQGYITQPEREDAFEIIELPNGRYGQVNARTGKLVKELSAEEAANGGGSGGGGGGLLSPEDRRLWHKDLHGIFAEKYKVPTDDMGALVNDGGSEYETAMILSDLGAQVFDQSIANGQLISAQQAANRVQQVAYNGALNREDAMALARQSLGIEEGGEVTPELIEETNQILMDEYAKARVALGLTQDTDQYEQGVPQSAGQNWQAPMLMSGQQQTQPSQNLPDQQTLLDGGNPGVGGRAGLNNPPRPLGGQELESETPAGRRLEQVGNVSSNIAGLVNDTAGYIGGLAKSTGQAIAGIPERADQNLRYADWVRQVEDFIGGGSFGQAFQPQSEEKFEANKQIISFINSGRGRQLLSDNGRMQKIFTQDPEGFMAAAQQGLQPDQIEQYLIQQGRVEPRSNPVPVE